MGRRTFLVTGATGDTGGATVEQMLARGHHVRALAHRQDDRAKRLQGLGAEVVFGDFLNLDDVRAALRGVAGAYFCYPIRPGIIQATAFFAQAAKEAGVEIRGEHVADLGPGGRKDPFGGIVIPTLRRAVSRTQKGAVLSGPTGALLQMSDIKLIPNAPKEKNNDR